MRDMWPDKDLAKPTKLSDKNAQSATKDAHDAKAKSAAKKDAGKKSKKQIAADEEGNVASTFMNSIIYWGSIIAVTGVIIFLLHTFVGHAYTIPSGSMEHTIEIGDKIWSEKVSAHFSEYKQGDVVTFLDSEILSITQEGGKEEARTLIKRIIAVGGQTIDIKEGKVYIDGEEFDEPYALGNTYVLQDPMGTPYQTYPYTIPEGYVWVMGDNRENSADSRKFGPIAEDSITGRALFRFWPVTRLAVF